MLSLSEALRKLSWSRSNALGYQLEAGLQLAAGGDLPEGIRLLSVLDEEYPRNLRICKQRPAGLYVQGQILPGDERAVAVVGTRSPSPQGLARARRLGWVLGRAGVTVVSGLARGVDTAAHEGCLRAGGRTLAVLGHGLLHSYPPENAALQRGIACQGAVISQFAPDQKATRWSFPLRNRVIAGLATVSVAVECSEQSGTLSELKAALALGRPVMLRESGGGL
ncbi:MAG: DNA-protecting protein DprA [Candidatus Eremiobacteraeota bacterium]|nr:DNA-protecting protein DprA [Candidatus Eremiobacteraeota bacterium]